MSATPDSLADRYGTPRPFRRRVLLCAVAVVVLAFLGWLVWAMVFHADPAVSSQEIGHEIVDDHTATITVRITYGDGPVEATCRAVAIAADKMPVGEVAYSPDPAEGPDHVIEVRTDRRATTVQWDGCTTEGQPRPR